MLHITYINELITNRNQSIKFLQEIQTLDPTSERFSQQLAIGIASGYITVDQADRILISVSKLQ